MENTKLYIFYLFTYIQGIDKLIERNASELALQLCLKYELENKIINSNIFDSKTKLIASMRLLLV